MTPTERSDGGAGSNFVTRPVQSRSSWPGGYVFVSTLTLSIKTLTTELQQSSRESANSASDRL